MDLSLESFLPVLAAVLGACMGSFLNVVAHRSLEGRPWWGSERSVCESCGRVLSSLELIPILSWVAQRGRCRGCGARVSPRYLMVELIGALAAAGTAWRWGVSWAFLISLVGTFGLLLSALTDYEAGEVFDAFALSMGISGILIRLVGGRDAILAGLLGAAVGWGIFAVIILASRGGMGWGDACFMAGIGAILGWRLTLLAFYLGIMAGGVGIVVLMIRGKVRWGRGDSIPLVPYLAVGCYLTLIWGPQALAFLGERFGVPEAFLPPWPFR